MTKDYRSQNRSGFLANARNAMAGLALLVSGVGCLETPGIYKNKDYSKERFDLVSDTIRGSKTTEISNKSNPYELETPIVNGTRYHLKINENPHGDTLDFYLVKEEEARRTIDFERKTLVIESDKAYIPTKMKKSDGNLFTKAKLRTDGKFAKKATKTQFEIGDIEAGRIIESQDDNRFGISITKLNGKEFYTPRVEENLIDDREKLPFYLVPVERTRLEISPDGTMTLINEDGFYRPENNSNSSNSTNASINGQVTLSS